MGRRQHCIEVTVSHRKIISHAVWLYHRVTLSFRDVEDLLTERGVTVSYEVVQVWCRKFRPAFAHNLRRQDAKATRTAEPR